MYCIENNNAKFLPTILLYPLDDNELSVTLDHILRKYLNIDIGIINILLKKYQGDIDNYKFSRACRGKNIAIITALLQHKNNYNNISISAIQEQFNIACNDVNLPLIEILLQQPIDINTIQERLNHAVAKGNASLVELLLKNPNININQEDKYGDVALLIACEYGYYNIVEILFKTQLKIPIDINKQDRYGYTALTKACKHGQANVVQLLTCQQNIDVNQKDSCGITPLTYIPGKIRH